MTLRSTLLILCLLESSMFLHGQVARYPDLYGATKLGDQVEITGAAFPSLFRTLANRPQLYRFSIRPGTCQVRIHYLDAGDVNKGGFVVSHHQVEVAAPTPCLDKPPRGKNKIVAHARSIDFQVNEPTDQLELRFDRSEWNKGYGIAAIEVADSAGNITRIDCGASSLPEGIGKEWHPDTETFSIPDAAIQLDLPAPGNEWKDIGGEILSKLETNGVYAMPKYNGHYTRRLNSVIIDRSGTNYLALAGLGLWKLDRNANTLKRVDGGAYTGTPLDYQLNPEGPGFWLFSSHGFSGNTYQLKSTDGTPDTFGKFPGNYDFGAVDWGEAPPRTILAAWHHRTKLDLSLDGGKSFQTILKPGRPLAQVGVLPGGTLIHAIQVDRSGEPTPETGIYRSTDSGASWQKVSDLIIPHSCFDIPVRKGRAYVYTLQGLAVSDDDGVTWQLIANSPVFEHPVVFGARPGELLGFNHNGVFVSKDSGMKWMKVLPPPPKIRKPIQDHKYYDFAWDPQLATLYAFAPDQLYQIHLNW